MEVRRTILSPEDRVAAKELAALLGVSGDEVIQEFEDLSSEEQAEFERLVDQANAILPQLHASLDRIERGISRCRNSIRETSENMVAMSERICGLEGALGLLPVG